VFERKCCKGNDVFFWQNIYGFCSVGLHLSVVNSILIFFSILTTGRQFKPNNISDNLWSALCRVCHTAYSSTKVKYQILQLLVTNMNKPNSDSTKRKKISTWQGNRSSFTTAEPWARVLSQFAQTIDEIFPAKQSHRTLGISCFGASIVVDRLAWFVDHAKHHRAPWISTRWPALSLTALTSRPVLFVSRSFLRPKKFLCFGFPSVPKNLLP